MQYFDTQHIKNIVLLGATKSGKTTLAETMMFEGGVIHRRGAVEEGNTHSDYTEIEREKGYSVYASLLHTVWRDHKINIIDTPGNDNFPGEILAGLQAADTCIMVLNAQHGVEIGTEILWRHVEDQPKPVIVAVNQVDHDKADFEATLEQARSRLGPALIPMQFPYREGPGFDGIVDLLKMTMYKFPLEGGKPEKLPIPEDVREKAREMHNALVEAAAENDDALMELYFEKGALNEDEMRKGIRLGMLRGDIIPLFVVSAQQNMGTGRMMGFIDNVCPSASDTPPAETVDGNTIERTESGPPSLFVWKKSVEAHIGDVNYFKVISGVVSAGQEYTNARTGHRERFGSLFVADGKKKHPAEKFAAGDLGLAVKLRDAKANDTYHGGSDPIEYPAFKIPLWRIRTAVQALNSNDEDRVGEALNALAQNDPTLEVGYRSDLRQTIMSGQGDLHFAIVRWLLQTQHQLEVEFVKPRIAYRETVQGTAKAHYRHKKQSGGAGQFAEVYLQIDPYIEGADAPADYKLRDRQLIELPHGGTLEFLNCIVGGAIDNRFVPSVLKGILETMDDGPLTRSPVRDIRITLYDGKMHAVDSNEMAFKIAASHAFEEAFTAAQPKLLEPIMSVEVLTPDDVMGEVMTDLQGRRASIVGMGGEGRFQVIKAKVPLAELYRYSTTLRSITQGRASHTREFSEFATVSDHIRESIVRDLASVNV